MKALSKVLTVCFFIFLFWCGWQLGSYIMKTYPMGREHIFTK